MKKRTNETIWFLSIFLVAGCLLFYTNERDRNTEEGAVPTSIATPSATERTNSTVSYAVMPEEQALQPAPAPEATNSFFNAEGMTVETRFDVPEGYTRVSTEQGIAKYIRNMQLSPSGSKVHLYDGSEKGNQKLHAAVFSMDVGTRDLQQCADSIIKVYAEYMFQSGRAEEVSFHLTNGFVMEYSKWEEGYRLNVNGNTVNWVKKAERDNSYNNFCDYLTNVFTYAGTISLSKESKEIAFKEMQIGDLFIQGGSPGHCVLVVDMAKNSEGQICFLLAQGYMPAQEFHVIKNPLHQEDPWYYEEEFSYPFETVQWTFEEGTLKRFTQFELK